MEKELREGCKQYLLTKQNTIEASCVPYFSAFGKLAFVNSRAVAMISIL